MRCKNWPKRCFNALASTQRCSQEGCANFSQKRGVCVSHGAKIFRRSHEGCANGAIKGGVCATHGAKLTKKGGLCRTHGAESLTTSPGEVKRPPQPTAGFEATTAGVIARRGGEIDVCNMQANTSSAAARQSPSPRPSATAPDSSDDEELGDWIYKNWHRLKRLERKPQARGTLGS